MPGGLWARGGGGQPAQRESGEGGKGLSGYQIRVPESSGTAADRETAGGPAAAQDRSEQPVSWHILRRRRNSRPAALLRELPADQNGSPADREVEDRIGAGRWLGPRPDDGRRAVPAGGALARLPGRAGLAQEQIENFARAGRGSQLTAEVGEAEQQVWRAR